MLSWEDRIAIVQTLEALTGAVLRVAEAQERLVRLAEERAALICDRCRARHGEPFCAGDRCTCGGVYQEPGQGGGGR